MTERGRYRVIFDERLLNSIRNRENVLAKLLLRGNLIRAYDDYGTLLHYAAKYGNVEIAKHLIKKGSDVDSLGTVGYTPLTLAVHQFHPGVVEVLLQAGANIEISGENRQSALQMIFDHKCLVTDRTYQVFFNKLKTQLSNTEELVAKLISAGCTLYHAAYSKDFDLIQCMVNSGVDIESTGYRGQTGLHAAAQLNDLDLAKYLVSHGVNVNALDTQGYNAVLLAARWANKDFLQFLLEHGANPNAKTHHFEHTPLFEVISRIKYTGDNLDECMELLLQHGAIPHNPVDPYATIYDYAVETSTANYLIAQLAMFEKMGNSIDRSVIHSKRENDLSELVNYYKVCERVLELTMFQNLSLLNLLSISEYKMKIYVRSETFQPKIEEVCSKQKLATLYPYYYKTLIKRIETAVDLVKLENIAIPVLCGLMGGNENKYYIAAKQIIGYLKKHDLEQLVRV